MTFVKKSRRRFKSLRVRLSYLLVVISATFFALTSAGTVATVVDDGSPGLTWDLRDLYETPASWDAAFREARAEVEKLDRYQTTIGASAESMLEALNAISSLRRVSARLGVYAALKGDEDLRVAAAQERRSQAQALGVLLKEKTAWLAPAILAIGQDKIHDFLANNEILKKRFDFFLEDTLRRASHTLGTEAEGLLAAN